MIKENIQNIQRNIQEVCIKTGRKPSEIRIIAVTKNTGLNSIREVVDHGLTNLGESKAQELTEKSGLFDENICWHFIGHLQSNKVKYVVNSAGFIHSIDSIKIADEINRYALKRNKTFKVLLEVNTSGESNKYGISELTDLLQVADYCESASNLKLVGLMTMAPYTDEEKIIRKCFSDLRKLRSTLNEQGYDLTELSMGMSNDYLIAIEEGSTMIRLGTAIFGERDYSKSWKEQ